jgi:hypothetical protein
MHPSTGKTDAIYFLLLNFLVVPVPQAFNFVHSFIKIKFLINPEENWIGQIPDNKFATNWLVRGTSNFFTIKAALY